MAQYGRPEYWEDRYQKDEESFDWYQKWEQLKPYIEKAIPNKKGIILNAGCGNSTLAEDMYEDGFDKIINIDISNTVIRSMVDKYKDRYPLMPYKIMDVKNLGFPEHSFEAIIDKGCFDAVLCSDSSGPNSA